MDNDQQVIPIGPRNAPSVLPGVILSLWLERPTEGWVRRKSLRRLSRIATLVPPRSPQLGRSIAPPSHFVKYPSHICHSGSRVKTYRRRTGPSLPMRPVCDSGAFSEASLRHPLLNRDVLEIKPEATWAQGRNTLFGAVQLIGPAANHRHLVSNGEVETQCGLARA